MSDFDDSTTTPRTLIEGFLTHKQVSQSVVTTRYRDHALRQTPNKYRHPPELTYIHTRSVSKRQSSAVENSPQTEQNGPQQTSKRSRSTRQLVDNDEQNQIPSTNQSRSRRRLSTGNRKKTPLSTRVMRTQLHSMETPRFTPKSAIEAFLSHAPEQIPTVASQAEAVASKSKSNALEISNSSHQLIVQSPLSESAVFEHAFPVSKRSQNKGAARPPVNFTLDSVVEDMGDEIRDMTAEQSGIEAEQSSVEAEYSGIEAEQSSAETQTQHLSDIDTQNSDADDEYEGEDRSDETRLRKHNSIITRSDKETSIGAKHDHRTPVVTGRDLRTSIGTAPDQQNSIAHEHNEIISHIEDDNSYIETDNIDGAVNERRHSKRLSTQNIVEEDKDCYYKSNDDNNDQSKKDTNRSNVHVRDYIIDHDDGDSDDEQENISGQHTPVVDVPRAEDNAKFNGAGVVSDAEDKETHQDRPNEDEGSEQRVADDHGTRAAGSDRGDQVEAHHGDDDISEAGPDDEDKELADASAPGDDNDDDHGDDNDDDHGDDDDHGNDDDPANRLYDHGDDTDDDHLETPAYREEEINNIVQADALADDDRIEDLADDIENDDVSGADSEPQPSTSQVTQSTKLRSAETITMKKVVKPRRPRKTHDGMPTNLTKSIFAHFCRRKVRKDTIAEVEKVADEFWKRVVNDLDAYTKHAHRKTIEFEDVELLMKRQGFTSEKCTMDSLVRKYLPLEYRQALIPMAQSGNKLLLRK